MYTENRYRAAINPMKTISAPSNARKSSTPNILSLQKGLDPHHSEVGQLILENN